MNNMLCVGFPYGAAVGLFLCFKKYIPWREAFVAASLVWGSYGVATLELLGIFHHIERISLTLAWSALIVVTIIWWTVSPTRDVPRGTNLNCLAFLDRFSIGVCVVILALVGLTAIIAPPNSWDALWYHMPRVAFWAEQKSLSFYSAGSYQELFQPPGAEMIILQSFVLSKSDRFANIGQWFAFGGCGLVMSLIAAELRLSVRVQILTALVVYTIPEVVLQSSGAKNMVVEAYWLAGTTFYCLRIVRYPRRIWILAAGTALGLAFLTKGTAYLYGCGILIVFIVAMRDRWKRGIAIATLIMFVALLINARQYVRNLTQFGSPLGCVAAECGHTLVFTNGRFGIDVLVSNIVRNIALHFSTPFAAVNKLFEQLTIRGLHILGIDPDDPTTTWSDTHFGVLWLGYDEGTYPNSLHLLLLGAALGWAAAKARPLFLFAMAPLAGFAVFCYVFRWQPWNSRLHATAFILSAPLIAAMLFDIKSVKWRGVVVALLLASVASPLMKNNYRALIGHWGADFRGNVWNRSRTEMRDPDHTGDGQAGEFFRARLNEAGCHDVTLEGPFHYSLIAGLGIGLSDIQASRTDGVPVSGWHVASPCAHICVACSETRLKASQCNHTIELRYGRSVLALCRPG